MFDFGRFTSQDMQNCAIALRNMGDGATNMEDVANRMVQYLYQSLIDPQTGRSSCALVRLFKTHPYGELSEDLQRAACDVLGGRPANLSTQCLTLLATAGDEPHWNVRQLSTGHQAIPLIDRDFVDQAPMISQLIQQFGLDIETVIEPAPEVLVDLDRKTFNVFYVPEALGSVHIPAQRNFVIPYHIQSVLGFGGMLPTGNLFAIIMFTKSLIPQSTADLFKWIAAYARISIIGFEQGKIFSGK
jgi:hypothetical protein